MKVSAGTRGTSVSSDRQVTISVTGIARNDFVRTADTVMKVPYTRMNDTLRPVHRLGGKVTGVTVTGTTSQASEPRKAQGSRKKQG